LKLAVFFSSRRRHTRLQGDWSSDVCSSDLFLMFVPPIISVARGRVPKGFTRFFSLFFSIGGLGMALWSANKALDAQEAAQIAQRSEERRVGKEGRPRGGPDHDREHPDIRPA